MTAALLAAVSLFAPVRGMALSPHYERPEQGLRFDTMVDEIAQIRASHISIVVSWGQETVASSEIAPHPTETQSDEVIRRLIRRARARGLKVMLFPILWVEQRKIGEWRGTLKPSDPERWWRGYEAFILHYARMAAEERAAIFSVGSEFASLEHEAARWYGLIAQVRGVFRGQLLYSANWDHYVGVPFWDAVDLVGLTGYYRLTESLEPSAEELVRAWADVRDRLTRWQRIVQKPLVFTEVGYPSIDGAARSPWDYTQGRSLDLEEQRLAYEAFYTVWIDEPALSGVFFWNWWGPGGADDPWYTPKGKPAEAVIRRWFRHVN